MGAPYYERDGVTLYCGDCADILPQLTADVVITDPPYNAGKNYGTTTNDRQSWPDWCAWWRERLNLLLEAAPDVLAFMSQTAYREWVEHGTYAPDWTLIWHKPLSMAICALPFMPHWEPIAYWGASRKHHGKFWGSDVLTHNVMPNQYGHPTEKPLPLMRDLVGRFSGTILDPFAGSGTTLVAAKALGLRAIGIEINPDYCDIAVRRLAQQTLPLPQPEQPAMLLD